ncbi:hypothetical protein [Streptomyces phaeofaciens]|nr:hypothetical protein [Streptomyces phaeofaciens]
MRTAAPTADALIAALGLPAGTAHAEDHPFAPGSSETAARSATEPAPDARVPAALTAHTPSTAGG